MGRAPRARRGQRLLRWRRLPAGARPSAFAFDPRRPNVVYVTSAHDRGGVYVYKTTDGGRHWQPTGARGTDWVSDILSLTADPRYPGILYAGTNTAVYKTVDGGRTWQPFRQGLFPPHGGKRVCYSQAGASPYCVKLPFGTPGTTSWNRNNGWVLGMAVDPADSNVVYSAAGEVRKSTDGGHTWRTVLLPYPTQGHSVSRIAIAPTRPESIYAIAHTTDTGRTTIYQSTDAGRTWHPTGSRTSVLPNSHDWDSSDALAVDAQHPRTVYAAVGHRVLKTTDAGANWQPITNGLPVGVSVARDRSEAIRNSLCRPADRRRYRRNLQDDRRRQHLEPSGIRSRNRNARRRSRSACDDLGRRLGRLVKRSADLVEATYLQEHRPRPYLDDRWLSQSGPELDPVRCDTACCVAPCLVWRRLANLDPRAHQPRRQFGRGVPLR